MILSANHVEQLRGGGHVLLWLPEQRARELRAGEKLDTDPLPTEVVSIRAIPTYSANMRGVTVRKWGAA